MSATTTITGLTVRCQLDETVYPKGIVVSDKQIASLNIAPTTSMANGTTPSNLVFNQINSYSVRSSSHPLTVPSPTSTCTTCSTCGRIGGVGARRMAM